MDEIKPVDENAWKGQFLWGLLFGPEIIKEAERQVHVVRENLKVAQSRQKSYADTRRRELTFEEGDYVYLLSP